MRIGQHNGSSGNSGAPVAAPDVPPAIVTYCTNSHAGDTLDKVEGALDDVFADVRQRLDLDGQLAVGLWLPATTVSELVGAGRLQELKAFLRERGFFAPSLNAFPYGPFHQDVVKERVYHPAWWDEARVQFTIDSAHVLAELLADRPDDYPADVPGAISTLGGGDARELTDDRRAQMFVNLGRVARELESVQQGTGHEIVLGLEPEPLTVLELTPSSIEFFQTLFADPAAREAAGGEDVLRRHIGLCFDACHQAVLWEDVPVSYRRFREAGIRIAKVQVSAAVECPAGIDRHAALERYAEPRYLHQVYASPSGNGGAPVTNGRMPDGQRDLPDALSAEGWQPDSTWRCHFHVPIFLHELGYGLLSTRASLERLLAEIRASAAAAGDPVPLLEVETYTWSVLPDGLEPEYDPDHPGGPAGITAEMDFVRRFWHGQS